MNVMNVACPAVPGLLIRARRGHVYPLQLFQIVFHPLDDYGSHVSSGKLGLQSVELSPHPLFHGLGQTRET